jgi:hypothetical protein
MSTLGTLGAFDSGATSRDTINNNFTALNTDKIETAALTAGLATKANISHTHAQSDVTNLVSDLAGKAASTHSHAGADITSGTVATARLASGTANATTFLRGDQTWASPATGGSDTWIMPGQGYLQGATLGTAAASSTDIIPAVKFDDTNTDRWKLSTVIPTGKTGIASIVVYYMKSGAASGNLRLVFYTSVLDLDTLGADDTQDVTDTLTTYTNANTELDTVTVPSGAYNGLTIAAGDLFSISIERLGGDASDTFTSDWDVIAVKITWS